MVTAKAGEGDGKGNSNGDSKGNGKGDINGNGKEYDDREGYEESYSTGSGGNDADSGGVGNGSGNGKGYDRDYSKSYCGSSKNCGTASLDEEGCQEPGGGAHYQCCC